MCGRKGGIMKLRNKKTGEIGTYLYSNSQHFGPGWYSVVPDKNPMKIIEYKHDFKKLYEEWDFIGEDYEEPKGIQNIWREGDEVDIEFYDSKEAEQEFEKLKAWKRLKNKGFRFDGYDVAHNGVGDLCGQAFYNAGKYCIEDIEKDLDLLFGGEE